MVCIGQHLPQNCLTAAESAVAFGHRCLLLALLAFFGGGGGGQLGSSVDLSQAGLQVELGSFAKVSRAV